MSHMKILILGKNGQVGWELQRSLQPLGEVIALDRHEDIEHGFCGDITNFKAIEKVIQTFQPDIVLNATAYTAVDKAESEVEQADLINHTAVKHLAEQCKAVDALLIHYSTDYVFNGQGTAAWQEDDKTEPQNAYGKTKRNGEIALERSQVKFINLRTSWVYASRGHNFIKTMLKLAQSKDELSIIDDQIGAPTGAALIADVTAQIVRYYVLQPQPQQKHLLGHYHLAAQGETSWYAYANYIFDVAKAHGLSLQIKTVKPISTVDYPTPAVRPLNSRLNTHKLQQTFALHLPQWQQGVEHMIKETL